MTGPAPRFSESEVRVALEEAGSIKAAAALLGTSRKAIYGYIRRYHIEVRRSLTAG